jgi:hypothetical protein
MAGPSKLREIVENHLYADQLGRLGDIERLDDALSGSVWAISNLAEEFPIVPGTTALRVVKTEKLKVRGGMVQLRIWFTILNENQVELLFVEVVPRV